MDEQAVKKSKGGRNQELENTVRKTITIPASFARELRRIGNDNLSEGVRVVTRAYTGWPEDAGLVKE